MHDIKTMERLDPFALFAQKRRRLNLMRVIVIEWQGKHFLTKTWRGATRICGIIFSQK